MNAKERLLELSHKQKEMYLEPIDMNIIVKEVNLGVRKRIDKINNSGRTDYGRFLLLSNSMHEMDGNRMFSENEEESMNKIPAGALEEVFNVAYALSFTTAKPEDIKLLKKS